MHRLHFDHDRSDVFYGRTVQSLGPSAEIDCELQFGRRLKLHYITLAI